MRIVRSTHSNLLTMTDTKQAINNYRPRGNLVVRLDSREDEEETGGGPGNNFSINAAQGKIFFDYQTLTVPGLFPIHN